jgi:hypothetical protein
MGKIWLAIPFSHTYHSHFIPEGVAEASQNVLRAVRNIADVTDGKPIAV